MGKIFYTGGYLFFAFLAIFLVRRFFHQLVFRIFKIKNQKLLKKAKTLQVFGDSLISLLLLLLAFFLILDFWGVNLLPFLTGAGIFGLAISFGAQSLVKDLISGLFIILENQFNVGDTLKIGNFSGRVVKITLRQTILEDEEGNLIFLPNSQIGIFSRLRKSMGKKVIA